MKLWDAGVRSQSLQLGYYPVTVGNLQRLRLLEFDEEFLRDGRIMAVALQSGHQSALAVNQLIPPGDVPFG